MDAAVVEVFRFPCKWKGGSMTVSGKRRVFRTRPEMTWTSEGGETEESKTQGKVGLV